MRAILVDSDALRADHLVRLVHAVDEGQRHLVDVEALVRQILAVLAAEGRARRRSWAWSAAERYYKVVKY